jgi:hypothetical protein
MKKKIDSGISSVNQRSPDCGAIAALSAAGHQFFKPGLRCRSNESECLAVRLLSTLVRVRYFGIDPVPEQKRLAASRRIHVKNCLSMMFLHHQYQIRLAQILRRQLPCPMRRKIKPARLHHGLDGLVRRLIHQGADPRRRYPSFPACRAFKLLPQHIFGNRTATNVAGADDDNGIKQKRSS